jgi:hypothetical protein
MEIDDDVEPTASVSANEDDQTDGVNDPLPPLPRRMCQSSVSKSPIQSRTPVIDGEHYDGGEALARTRNDGSIPPTHGAGVLPMPIHMQDVAFEEEQEHILPSHDDDDDDHFSGGSEHSGYDSSSDSGTAVHSSESAVISPPSPVRNNSMPTLVPVPHQVNQQRRAIIQRWDRQKKKEAAFRNNMKNRWAIKRDPP